MSADPIAFTSTVERDLWIAMYLKAWEFEGSPCTPADQAVDSLRFRSANLATVGAVAFSLDEVADAIAREIEASSETIVKPGIDTHRVAVRCAGAAVAVMNGGGR